MNAPELLRAYLSKIQDPAAVAALFAEDGVLELPQMNVPEQEHAEIEKFIRSGLSLQGRPNVHRDARSGLWRVLRRGGRPYHRVYKQTYFGRLVAEKGKIKLIREALDILAGQLIPRRSSPIGESACVWLR